MTERLTSARSLNAGDVVTVAVEMRDRHTGSTYWWTRFCCVTRVVNSRCQILTLKMQLTDKDERVADFSQDVICKVDPKDWPQGVIAMRTKWITLGRISLKDSED